MGQSNESLDLMTMDAVSNIHCLCLGTHNQNIVLICKFESINAKIVNSLNKSERFGLTYIFPLFVGLLLNNNRICSF